jgi:hypothetical protein
MLSSTPDAIATRPLGARLIVRAAIVLAILSLTALSDVAPPLGAADLATVTFSLSFPGSDPERYSISVGSDGHAHYECSARIASDSEDREDYESDFTVSDIARTRIFDLAQRAHYFSGKIDSGNKKIAFTGAKRLIYKNEQRSFTADYNFSTVQPVQELTVLFQNVAATLEFGRRLSHYHRFQKLALDAELKRMEEQAGRGDLNELQAINPVLQEIHDDPSVINIVRARVQRLMEMAKATASQP